MIPLVLAWPVAGFIVYLVYRSSKRHDEREALERERALTVSEPS